MKSIVIFAAIRQDLKKVYLMKKNSIVQIRFSLEELTSLDMKRKFFDMSRSQFIRFLVKQGKIQVNEKFYK